MNNKFLLLVASLVVAQQSQALVFEEDRMVWDREEAESLGLRIPAQPFSSPKNGSSTNQQPIKSMFESTSNKYWWESEKVANDVETFVAIFKIIDQEVNKLEKTFVQEMWSLDLSEYSVNALEDVPHLAQLWNLVNSSKQVKQFKPAIVSIFSSIQSMITDGTHVSSHSTQLANQLVRLCDDVESVVTTAQKKDLIAARDAALALMCTLA
jgi:hypothetical protein